MLYTSNLLKRYISLDVDIEEIARELTLKTCEVEEIHHRDIPDLVVIWKVIEKTSHPDADKLSVCKVDCGKKWIFQICCGAMNVDADMYVPVALPGCFLPSLNLTIEPRKMRWQESNGMICSKAELWIPEDLEEKWIWILQYTNSKKTTEFHDITEIDVWISLSEKYPWLVSWTIDVENKTITHRPDLFWHFGISNELQAIFPSKTTFSGGNIVKERMRDQSVFELLDHATACTTDIAIESDLVYSYVLVHLEDTTCTKSDLYLRSILYDLWIWPKSNWVDFSNAFMYLTWQPIHCFDADKVQWNITVRQAKQWEIFVDLFETHHTLTTSDIVICDEQWIIALAGIIWGKDSGVTQNTKNILVEVANFNDVQVRKTAMRLWLRTDAQVRFEKEINPLFSLHATLMLLDELKYFSKSLWRYIMSWIRWWVNDNAQTHVLQTIWLDTLAVEKMLFWSNGEDTNIHDKDILEILIGLWCTVTDDWNVHIPLRRWPSDIECEADIIEEIARMYGFHNIPEIPYKDLSTFVPYEQDIRRQRALEDALIGTCRYDQIETYPWMHQRWIEYFNISTDTLYSLRDIQSPEQQYMRNSLLSSLVEVIEKNVHFLENGRIFDMWKVWSLDELTPWEQQHIWLACWQKKWDTREDATYIQLRSHIDYIFTTLWVRGKIEYRKSDTSYFHPKQQAEIYINNMYVWYIWVVHPSLQQFIKAPKNLEACVCELNLSELKQFAPENKKLTSKKYATLQDQIVSKDLNFVLDTSMSRDTVTNSVSKIREIDSLEIFDMYQWKHVWENEKSIAIRISVHTNTDKEPLTNDQINEVMQKAIESVEKTGARLR